MTDSPSRTDAGPSSGHTGVHRGRDALETVVARLRIDNDGLRTSLRHRAVIEQAKGVLMARSGATPEQAFARLVEHSQRTNQKLVRVAAAVVGATVTAREPVAADVGFDLAALLGGPPGDDGERRRADRRLAGAALVSALDLDELAQIVAHEAAAALAPDAVVLAALEPDGALRLVGGAGLDRQLMSAWQRIPPSMDVPLVAAARTDTPVLLGALEARLARHPGTQQGPHAHEAQANVPLRIAGRTVGVLALSWDQPRTFTDADETVLQGIAGQVVKPFLTLLHADDEELPHVAVEVARTRWFRAALDAVLAPLFLLSPVRDAQGNVTDFEVTFVNREALGRDDPAADGQIVGRTVLALYPATAGRRMFEVFCEVLETGRSAHHDAMAADEHVDGSPDEGAVELSVARLGDGLLVSWRHLER